jgi:transcriptional regulator with XRE-family HTH domain
VSEPIILLVSANIRRLREQMNVSQEGFAIRVGMDRSSYGRIERGGTNISLTTLAKLATALDVTPAELLKSTDSEAREHTSR